ncbi:MAG: asparagine synthase (glutamine-hydrolyzing) [Planctomycetota bacterium]|jgi:asparagine synthase (glutamine-hydrolysing)
MCGIAGVWGGQPDEVERMVAALHHRGPDKSGVASLGEARVGCARLAIRGGALGDQPLKTARGLLVFNGEIYNTDELVKDLAWHGIEVSGASDTEVVGRLLDVYGIKAVDRLNGMFALAWTDGRALYLARDPAGIKPLYYRDNAFASTIAPLLGDDRRLNSVAVARWLTFHVAYGAETFFEGIRRVPAGGVVELPGGRTHRRAAPGLAFTSPNPALTEERLAKVLQRAVRDAVPDERYGVALSGGIDSTLVAALSHGDRIAYHGRVDADGCDESAYARAAASALDIPLVEVPITAEACWRALPAVVRALEEPVAGPGSLAQYLVAERAAQDVRVMFSGCGGDELFGGYARSVALVHDDPPEGWAHYEPLFQKGRGKEPAERAYALLQRRDGALFTEAFTNDHPAPKDAFVEAFSDGTLDPLAAAARAEMNIVLPGLLQVEDRVTMAHSIEARVPLLDRRLLRVAARLAPESRVAPDGTAKALLRAAAADHLPPVVRERRDKMGFPLPLGDWFAGPWREPAKEILLDRRTREQGILDVARAENALTGHARYDRGLYSALLFATWYDTCFFARPQ